MRSSSAPALRLLISFAYARTIDLPRVLEAAHGLDVELFADSGAFTVRHSGGVVRLADYAAWLRELGPLARTAANLDVIGDHAASARNLEALAGHGLRVLPVFHLGSPWTVLEQMCREHAYVALGNLPTASRDLPLAMRNIIRCFRVGREHGTVFHGFGLTHPELLGGLPFYSTDSSTWTQGLRYAWMSVFDERAGRLIATTFGGKRAPDLRAIRRLIREHGGDAEVLAAPGCGIRSRRSEEAFLTEKAMVYRVNVVAMLKYERWLRARHQVAAPPGLTGQGTRVYLAGTTTHALLHAVAAAHWLRARESAPIKKTPGQRLARGVK